MLMLIFFSIFTGFYRFFLLFFNCMLTFGSYFCFDMPSVLQGTFTKPVSEHSSYTKIKNF